MNSWEDKCPSCSKQVLFTDRFCQNCGYQINRIVKKDSLKKEVAIKLNAIQMIIFLLVLSYFLLASFWIDISNRPEIIFNFIIGLTFFSGILIILNEKTRDAKKILIYLFVGCVFYSILIFNLISLIIAIIGLYLSYSGTAINHFGQFQTNQEIKSKLI